MSATRIAIFLLAGISCAALAAQSNMLKLFDFESDSEEPRWVAVNDGVMGGRSSGGPTLLDGKLRFSGVLSLENNGGFSSVRTVGRSFDLSAAKTAVLRVRGDGRTYQLRLATDARFRGITISYGGEFATVAGQWLEARVALAALRPSAHGFALNGPAFNPARIREIGLLLGDKRPGEFQLEVDWIAVE
jgi:monofunctional biosynthetic peptidoglycan transglycosylase